MEYQIEGAPLPVVICQLEAGETMLTERGSMSWMTPNMKMETSTNGGLGKARRLHFPEPLHRPGRPRTDRLCLQFPGQHPGL